MTTESIIYACALRLNSQKSYPNFNVINTTERHAQCVSIQLNIVTCTIPIQRLHTRQLYCTVLTTSLSFSRGFCGNAHQGA